MGRAHVPNANFERLADRVYRWVDTCAVYVITSGEHALLIDVGAGDVLARLRDLGVETVDYVVHTHHHRDQVKGDELLAPSTGIVVPAREASYFERAEELWQMVTTADLYDVSNQWNRPARDVSVTGRLADYEVFTWEGIEFLTLPTPGHTKGSVTYLGDIDGVRWAFCGDLVHSHGRVPTVHDLQWGYLEDDGVAAALRSVRTLRRQDPDRVGPSHGRVDGDPDAALAAVEEHLSALWDVFAVGLSDIWEIPAPPLAPQFEDVSEHLVTVRSGVAHFHVLHTGGHALFFDYGFPSWTHVINGGFRFVEHSLAELRDGYGIEHVDVIVPTHYHDDHVCGIPFLQKRFGCEVWAYEVFAHLLERPSGYRLPALWPQPMRVTRRIRDRETIDWRGFRFVARHNPGHTHYAATYLGTVDGIRIAVTGDAFERDRERRLRPAGPIYRNRVGLGDFATTIATVEGHKPDVLLTGHIGASRVEGDDFADALRWSENVERAWRSLAPNPDAIGFALDPDAISFDPYAIELVPGGSGELEVEVRNYFDRPVEAHLRVLPPPGWRAEPSDRELTLGRREVGRTAFTFAVPADAVPQRYVATVDATIDGERFGEAAEALLSIAPS